MAFLNDNDYIKTATTNGKTTTTTSTTTPVVSSQPISSAMSPRIPNKSSQSEQLPSNNNNTNSNSNSNSNSTSASPPLPLNANNMGARISSSKFNKSDYLLKSSNNNLYLHGSTNKLDDYSNYYQLNGIENEINAKLLNCTSYNGNFCALNNNNTTTATTTTNTSNNNNNNNNNDESINSSMHLNDIENQLNKFEKQHHYNHYTSQQALNKYSTTKTYERPLNLKSSMMMMNSSSSTANKLKPPSSYLAMKKYFNTKLIENNMYNSKQNSYNNFASTTNLNLNDYSNDFVGTSNTANANSPNNIYSWLNSNSSELFASDAYDQRSTNYAKYIEPTSNSIYNSTTNLNNGNGYSLNKQQHSHNHHHHNNQQQQQQQQQQVIDDTNNLLDYDLNNQNYKCMTMSSYNNFHDLGGHLRSSNVNLNSTDTALFNYYKNQSEKLSSLRKQMCNSRASSTYCNCYSPTNNNNNNNTNCNDCSTSIIDYSTTTQSNTNSNSNSNNIKQLKFLNKQSQNSLINLKASQSSSSSSSNNNNNNNNTSSSGNTNTQSSINNNFVTLSQQQKSAKRSPNSNNLNKSLIYDDYDLGDYNGTNNNKASDLYIESYSDLNSFNQISIKPSTNELKQYK